MKYVKHVATLAALAMVAACADAPDAVIPSAPAGLAARSTDIAAGLAQALAAPAARTAVLSAMRASPWVNHALILQDFLRTSDGSAIAAGAAQALGITPDAFARQVAAMPRLEMAMPVQQHRRTWTGGADVVVALHLTRAWNAVTVHAVDGSASAWNAARAKGAAGEPALILLQPARTLVKRVAPQPARPGTVIEDAGDGTAGGLMTVYLANGDSIVREIADDRRFKAPRTMSASELAAAAGLRPSLTMLEECDPSNPTPECDTGGGGGGSAFSGPPTYVHALQTVESCGEEGPGICGDNEFEFKWAYTIAGQTIDGKLRVVGIPPSMPMAIVDWQMSPYSVKGSGDYMWVEVWETDVGTDDKYGAKQLTSLSQRGVIQNYGFPRCQPYYQYTCLGDDPNHWLYEVETSYTW